MTEAKEGKITAGYILSLLGFILISLNGFISLLFFIAEWVLPRHHMLLEESLEECIEWIIMWKLTPQVPLFFIILAVLYVIIVCILHAIGLHDAYYGRGKPASILIIFSTILSIPFGAGFIIGAALSITGGILILVKQ